MTTNNCNGSNDHNVSINDDDRPSTSADAGNAPVQWTVCAVCHGEGRHSRRRRMSKKTRFKQQQQQQKQNQQQAPSLPFTPLHFLMDTCQACRGSGLKAVAAALVTSESATCASASPPPSSSSSSSNSSSQQPILTVAIVGGGIAGLALAAALQHRQIFRVQIFERDGQFDERRQGYGLTLQQAALQLTALGIPVPLKAGVTSTKHIVHNTKGTVMGTWGMRHWTKSSSANDTNHETVTKSNSNDDTNEVAHVCSRRGRPESAATDDNGNVPPTDTKRRKRQNVHIARQALRYELFRAATAIEQSQNTGSYACPEKETNDTTGSESVIRWGHRLVDYVETKDHVELTFDVVTGDRNNGNQTSRTIIEKADLVVGADGIRSRVRQQLVPKNHNATNSAAVSIAPPPLRYLDCMVILGICPLTLVAEAAASSSFAHLLDGETVFQTADGVTRMYMMPFSTTEYMWQLSFPMAEEPAAHLSIQGSGALQAEALRRCGDWHAPIPLVLSSTPVALVSGYPVYDHPILRPQDIPRFNHDQPRRVTCVGDSIHCMSPFKGQGANQALLDALSLARTLYRTFRPKLAVHDDRHGDDTDSATFEVVAQDIENAILEYEAEMLERSAVKVTASAEAAHFLHTPIAIQVGNVTRGAAAAAINTTQGNLTADK